MPKIATATSKLTPTTYSGTAKAIRRCGGICATTNMMAPAISMLRPWSANRVPLSKPDEYMISSPAQASKKTANASKPSKPCNIGSERWNREGLSKTAAMIGIICQPASGTDLVQGLINFICYKLHSCLRWYFLG